MAVMDFAMILKVKAFRLLETPRCQISPKVDFMISGRTNPLMTQRSGFPSTPRYSKVRFSIKHSSNPKFIIYQTKQIFQDMGFIYIHSFGVNESHVGDSLGTKVGH